MVQQRVRFTDVQGDLPASSWYRRHAEDFEHAYVWVLEADATLGSLNLDEPGYGQAGPEAEADIVLAKGNLTVTGSIFNADTDGSAGLVVLGNLDAGNMIVGGQVIEVGGDLRVRDLFWGDYNHGLLTAAGRAEARFWLATEQYRYEVAGGLTVEGAHWDDDSADTLPPHPCRATLSPWFSEALIEPGGPDDYVGGWLSREAALDAARAGHPLLTAAAPPLTRPPRMAGDALTADNLQCLLHTMLAAGPAIKQCSQFAEDPFWRLSLPVGGYRGGFYVEVDTRRYFAKTREVVPGRLRRMLGGKPSLALVVEFTDESGEAAAWRDLSADEVAHDETLQAVWRACLATVARAEPAWRQLSGEVTVARIEELLDLPFVRSDFENYDDDHEYGRYTLAVRQASEGTPRICLGWQGSDTRDEDGDREYCWAHFVVATSEDGRKEAKIEFQPRTSGGKIYDVRCFLARVPEVLTAFQAIEAILLAEQAASTEREAARAAQLRAAREIRWRGRVLPEDGWLTVPLRRTNDESDAHVPVARFRLATPIEVQDEIEALRFAGKALEWLDRDLDYDAPRYFLVMDEDCALPCLELDVAAAGVQIAGYLFRGNLTLQSHLLEYDSDHSPLFMVKGDLSARNLSMGGNLFHVGGDLRCECLYGFYNHGSLVVTGAMRCDLVIAKDFRIRAGGLYSRALVHCRDIESLNVVLDGEGNQHRGLYLHPPTCSVKDVFPPDLCGKEMFWGMYFPDDAALIERMRRGECVVDRQRLDALYAGLPDALPRLFDWVFASPRLATGQLVVRDGERYDGDDYAFALANEAGERTIGLTRRYGYDYQLYICQAPDGTFSACHWIGPHDGSELATLFRESVTDVRLSPMAAKHAFLLALEQLAFLPYGHSLPDDAAVEDGDSVVADLTALDACVDDSSALAARLHALAPKVAALCPPDAVAATQLLEWKTVACTGEWRYGQQALHQAAACIERIEAYQHRLHAPDRFLHALGKLTFDAGQLDMVLALCARATNVLGAQAGVKALLTVRRQCGYWLHEAKRYDEARAANRTLRADAQALLGQHDAWLCPLLFNLAQNSYELDDMANATACLERALEIGLTHADGWAVDQALFQLGVLSHERGDDDCARDHFERRLAHARLAGDRALIAAAEASLSEWARRAGRGEEA